MKLSLKYVGYLISLAFLYLTFREVDYRANFSYISVPLLVTALCVNVGFFSLRALYQNSNLVWLKNDIPFSVSINSIAMAQCYNVFLPARIGELLRVFFLSQKTGLGKAKLLSYVVIEKFIDLLFFVILFFIIVIISTAVVKHMLVVSVAMTIAIAIGLFTYIRFNRTILHVVTILTPESIFPRIESLNKELLEGIYLFRTLRQIIKSSCFFLGAWACIGIIFYLVSWPFLDTLRLPLYAPLVLMVFSALSLAIPSAPSAIGTMHFAFLVAIQLMTDGHYDIDLAAGFIVVLHFFIILFDFVIGAILMGVYNISSTRASRQL